MMILARNSDFPAWTHPTLSLLTWIIHESIRWLDETHRHTEREMSLPRTYVRGSVGPWERNILRLPLRMTSSTRTESYIISYSGL